MSINKMSWIVLFVLCVPLGIASALDRPHVVWIIADDLGPELGCYGYGDVATPNLDRLAEGGTRYTHAFATAPVCSASRTAFITGQYQTTVGGHHHDTRDKRELPASIPTLIQLAREAGYFVTNGKGSATTHKGLTKSHFNFVYNSKTFFDGFDWSQRTDPEQRFFATVQIKEPHRGFVTNDRPRHDAVIPPYYPEHPVTRADWGNYLASVEVLDAKVGEVLDRLDQEGITDNTLVVFFGDHGRPHVRGKQWLYDGGLHVPLLVRWPKQVRPGTVDDRLVSLLDLMPTTLAAMGSQVDNATQTPAQPGHNLLDSDWEGHTFLYAARDRCGDAVDRIRSVRSRDFKYIRNFYPETPYLQHSGYKKLGYPVETLMKVMHQQGTWDTLFMSPTRPNEELYDLRVDAYEMNNLAGDGAYRETLATHRDLLDQWITETDDQGEVDEGLTVDLAAVKAEKWRRYEKVMRSRGLDPELSDRAYLQWWKDQLGVGNESSR